MTADSIKQVAVIGLGTMGHGIAQSFAAAGCRVRVFDNQPAMCASLMDRIASNLQQMTAAGVVDAQLAAEIPGRIQVCETESQAVEGAEFVTEAVAENLELKQELFARIEPLVSDEAVLASNSSTYRMTDTAARLKRPQRAVVTHWFNPPHIIPVVEVVPGEHTDSAVVDLAYDMMLRLGKQPVRLNQELPGFLVNRVQVAMFREIWDLLDRQVASPEEIDRAVSGSMGLRLAALGPLAINDFAGWDITTKVFHNLVSEIRSDQQLPARVADMISSEKYGVKTGAGVFEYPEGKAEREVAERDKTFLQLVRLLADRRQETAQSAED